MTALISYRQPLSRIWHLRSLRTFLIMSTNYICYVSLYFEASFFIKTALIGYRQLLSRQESLPGGFSF